jgi:hypothetical protein
MNHPLFYVIPVIAIAYYIYDRRKKDEGYPSFDGYKKAGVLIRNSRNQFLFLITIADGETYAELPCGKPTWIDCGNPIWTARRVLRETTGIELESKDFVRQYYISSDKDMLSTIQFMTCAMDHVRPYPKDWKWSAYMWSKVHIKPGNEYVIDTGIPIRKNASSKIFGLNDSAMKECITVVKDERL